MLTIYHPADCETPGEPFQVSNKLQAAYYFKKGFTPEPCSEEDIPIERKNKMLRKQIEAELLYLKDDYGNEEFQKLVDEELETVLLGRERERLESVGLKLSTIEREFITSEYGSYTELVMLAMKREYRDQIAELDYNETSDFIDRRYVNWLAEEVALYKEAEVWDLFLDDAEEESYSIDHHKHQGVPCITQDKGIKYNDPFVNDYMEIEQSSENEIVQPSVIEQINTNEEQKLCEFCGEPHDGSCGTGRFCCRSCSSKASMKKALEAKAKKANEHID